MTLGERIPAEPLDYQQVSQNRREPFIFTPSEVSTPWDDWNRFIREFCEWVNR